MSLLADLEKYKLSELTRLSTDLKFTDKINSSIDDVLKPIAKDLYDQTAPDLNQQTTLPEDHDVIVSMIGSALDKSADPSAQSLVSDSVNRNPGNSVGLVTGDQGSANLISSVANSSALPAATGLASIPQGGFSNASESSVDIYDSAKKMQQKVLNTVASSITSKPGIMPQLLSLSIQKFNSNGSELEAAFTRHSELTESIRTNTAALDINYYRGKGIFERTENADAILRIADTDLLEVRRQLIYEDIFNEDRYQYIRDYEILYAAQALVNYGGPHNRVAEIKGAITALDYVMALLERLYEQFYKHLQSLVDYFNKFITRMLFKGPMLAMLNQIQAEVRSLIRSMDSSIERRQAAIMPTMERLWYMELLIMYHKMFLTPKNVVNYFASDPGGHIAAYNPISSALFPYQTSMPLDLTLLRHQTDQYKYWAQRRLEDGWPNNPNIQLNITNLSAQIQNDNTSTSTQVSQTKTIASSYDVPMSDMPKKVLKLLTVAGMDRANDLLEEGHWPEFFSLTPDNSSYKGNLAISLGAAMASAVADPNTTFNSLESISNAQRAILNQKRADDLLSSTHARFKNDGQQAIIEDIKDTQNTVAAAEKFTTGGVA